MEAPQPRSHPRSRVHEDCRILALDGTELASCVMLDISRGGAKLRFAAWQEVPDTFILMLARKKLVRRPCKVAWRMDNAPGRLVGVTFLLPSAL